MDESALEILKLVNRGWRLMTDYPLGKCKTYIAAPGGEPVNEVNSQLVGDLVEAGDLTVEGAGHISFSLYRWITLTEQGRAKIGA